jgi:hypothetical protein
MAQRGGNNAYGSICAIDTVSYRCSYWLLSTFCWQVQNTDLLLLDRGTLSFVNVLPLISYQRLPQSAGTTMLLQ